MEIITTREDGSKRIQTQNDLPSKTDPSFAEDCDVNCIIAKARAGGEITHLAKVRGSYGDVSGLPDLHTALIQIKKADEAFLELPSGLRKLFHNKSANMLKFLDDPANDQEAIDMGLKSGVKTPIKTGPIEVIVKETENGDIPKNPPVPPQGT